VLIPDLAGVPAAAAVLSASGGLFGVGGYVARGAVGLGLCIDMRVLDPGCSVCCTAAATKVFENCV
jgi:hypothetical protein